MNRLSIEAGAIVLLLILGAFYRHSLILDGERRIQQQDAYTVAQWQAKVAALKVVQATELQELRDAHAKELGDIAAYYSNLNQRARGMQPSNKAGTSALPGTTATPVGGAAAAPVVREDVLLHPDVEVAFGLLAEQADKLAADCRREVEAARIARMGTLQ